MKIKPNEYFTVTDVAGLMEYNLCGYIMYLVATDIKTPAGNKQRRAILFLTIEEANTVKVGDKFVM